MPRPLRYDLLGIPQHITQRGNNHQATFLDNDDYERYLDCLWDASLLHCCDVHAYVLMPNHVHLLATPHMPQAIAKVMQSVGRRYVRYFNDRRGRSGTLWEGRYKASLVGSQSYLFNCYRYIELNPVRGRIVRAPDEYRWSSYRCNALGERDDIVTPHPEFLEFGSSVPERATEYRRLFGTELTEQQLDEIRRDVSQCRAFGPDQFKREVELKVRHSMEPARVGRPRKTVH